MENIGQASIEDHLMGTLELPAGNDHTRDCLPCAALLNIAGHHHDLDAQLSIVSIIDLHADEIRRGVTA